MAVPQHHAHVQVRVPLVPPGRATVPGVGDGPGHCGTVECCSKLECCLCVMGIGRVFSAILLLLVWLAVR